MASFFGRGVVACWAIGILGMTLIVEAAPPRRTTTPTSRRPTTTTKPTTPLKAPQTVKPSESTVPQAAPSGPAPQPPQPRREEDKSSDAATDAAPKSAIPHPAVSAEVKVAPQAPVANAPGSLKTAVPMKAAAPTIDVGPDAEGKYLLRYHFSNGETVRWRVEHHAKIVTSLQGTTQTAETVSISTKAWRVAETLPGGETRFIHAVEAIDMRQKLSGQQEISYNSATDKEAPPVFAEAAKQVGVPLTEVTLDVRGNVLKRTDKSPRPAGAATDNFTLILPDRALAIGESWTAPLDLQATDANGTPKSIKARNKLTLEKVTDGVAVIRNETQILSPLEDPTVEAQVIQAEQSGTVTFDLRRGRIVEQQSELDKEVFGFQGPESKLHYTTQFGEKLLDGRAATTAETEKSGNPLR